MQRLLQHLYQRYNILNVHDLWSDLKCTSEKFLLFGFNVDFSEFSIYFLQINWVLKQQTH